MAAYRVSAHLKQWQSADNTSKSSPFSTVADVRARGQSRSRQGLGTNGMLFIFFGLGAAAAVAALTAACWLLFALLLRWPPQPRKFLSFLAPQSALGGFLMYEGGLFNGVIFAVLLLPLLALQAFVIIVLEARDLAPER
jgi:hypothetical protein